MKYNTGVILASTLALSGCFIDLVVQGNGTASSFPGNMVCDNTGGPSCTKEYLVENTETLTAVPDPGWVFEKWVQDPEYPVCVDSESPVCETTMPQFVFDNPYLDNARWEMRAQFISAPGEDVATPVLSQIAALYSAIVGSTLPTPLHHYWYGQIEIGTETCFSIAEGLVYLWNLYVPGSPKYSVDYYPICGEGKLGTVEDDQRVLPLLPSIARDVHMVEIPGAGPNTPDSDMRSLGNFTRPHIPPYRGTKDGRIAMQSRTRSSANTNVFHFYIFEPKKINSTFLQS